MRFIATWLSERTTWVGLFALFAAFNVHNFTHEQQEALILVGISLVARNETRNN